MSQFDDVIKNGLGAFTENPSAIPLPDAKHIQEITKPVAVSGMAKKEEKPLLKYGKAYDAYCRWSALPKELRDPDTAVKFEKRYQLPKGYTTTFLHRTDFHSKRATYFWNWMMDLFPDVVYSMYKRSLDKSSSDAKAFADIIAKHLDLQKPAPQITNFTLVGVSQDKIDKLFTPKTYVDGEEVEDGG